MRTRILSPPRTLPLWTLFALLLVVAGCGEPLQPAPDGSALPDFHASADADDDDNFALHFNGTAQVGFTAAPVTLRTNNLLMRLSVKWAGSANTTGSAQTVFYNGHSACSGWGIIVDDPTGRVGVLAGGVAIVYTSAQLTPGRWQDIRVSRVAGVFRVTVDGVAYSVSNPGPNALGTGCGGKVTERTLVGSGSQPADTPGISPDPFNGLVDNAGILEISWRPRTGLTFWPFNEGRGTTATDIGGTVLTLQGNPAWVERDDDDDDDDEDDGDDEDDDDEEDDDDDDEDGGNGGVIF